MPFIDFIRHADTEPLADAENDRLRQISSLGMQQARAFGNTRKQAGETYVLSIISGLQRTVDTWGFIMAGRYDLETTDDWTSLPKHLAARKSVSLMFDPVEPDRYSRQRQAAYEMLGTSPLWAYYRECEIALTYLVTGAYRSLEVLLYSKRGRQLEGNVLIVGHAVYTNAIIHSMFFRELADDDTYRLMRDPALEPCAGYRLVFDEGGNLREMLDLPAPSTETA